MRERLTLPGHRVSYVRNSIYYIRNYALAEFVYDILRECFR